LPPRRCQWGARGWTAPTRHTGRGGGAAAATAAAAAAATSTAAAADAAAAGCRAGLTTIGAGRALARGTFAAATRPATAAACTVTTATAAAAAVATTTTSGGERRRRARARPAGTPADRASVGSRQALAHLPRRPRPDAATATKASIPPAWWHALSDRQRPPRPPLAALPRRLARPPVPFRIVVVSITK